jgi:light-regulated signal transduction histidine kinase (bacteriophytochrome)
MALLSLESGDPVAKAGGYFGFSPPGDYSAVEAVMLRLRVHPGRLAQFDLHDVIDKYAVVLVLSLILLVMFMAVVAVTLIIVNRASAKLLKERDAAQSALRDNIHQLEGTNRELEQFAYISSHDLREPLRIVSIYTALLERRYGHVLDNEAHQFLAFAREGAVRMDQLVKDLLEFSRIGRISDPLTSNPVADLVVKALDSLQIAIGEAGAEVRVPPNLPTILCNACEMVRVFQNLISNAVKFRSPERAPVVEIACHREGDAWLFSVSDNGIGIDPRYYDRVFMIFQRLHTRDQYKGTGIGLAICKKIIDAHGGRIWVEGTPGQGSTFLFTLPVDPVD